MAKESSLQTTVDVSTCPFTDLYEYVKKGCRKSLVDKLKVLGDQKGINYFKYLYLDKVKPWYQGLNLSREYVVTINRIRANHYNLAEPFSSVNIVASPLCECGEYNESVDHALWQCKNYVNQ